MGSTSSSKHPGGMKVMTRFRLSAGLGISGGLDSE